jgi:hypothetical protein
MDTREVVEEKRKRKIVTDAISKIKRGATNLRLAGNSIGDAGAIALAQALPGSKLTVLR